MDTKLTDFKLYKELNHKVELLRALNKEYTEVLELFLKDVKFTKVTDYLVSFEIWDRKFYIETELALKVDWKNCVGRVSIYEKIESYTLGELIDKKTILKYEFDLDGRILLEGYNIDNDFPVPIFERFLNLI